MEMIDDGKKRKLEGSTAGNGNSGVSSSSAAAAATSTELEEKLRFLLDPLRKDQLQELLLKLGMQYPTIAEEIRGFASSDPVHRKLFVRGLSWDTTSQTLHDVFSVHGEIEEGAVIYDKSTGKSRGYGFITYRQIESTREALREPSKMIDGRMVVCNLACEGQNSITSNTSGDIGLRKLYIGGLSADTSTEYLLKFFSRHGDIEEGSVAYDKDTNLSRGFGFLTYKTVEAARKAIDDPNKTLGGRNITVKLADTHKNKQVAGMAGYSAGYSAYAPGIAAYSGAYSGGYESVGQLNNNYTAVGRKREQVLLPHGYHSYFVGKP